MKNLPRDAIITIKKTEAQVRAIEAEAKEKAQEMIEETEQSCIQFCQKEREELVTELDSRLDALRQRSEALLDRSARSSEMAADELRERTKARMRGAVNIVLEEIEKQCQGKR